MLIPQEPLVVIIAIKFIIMFNYTLILLYPDRKKKRFRPTIPVKIYHDDGEIEMERVDLLKIHETMDANVEGQQLFHSEIPEVNEVDDWRDGNGTDESSDDGLTSAYYKKAEKKQKALENLKTEAMKRTFQFAGRNINPKCIH